MSTLRLHLRWLFVSLLACATLASEASAQGQPPRVPVPQAATAVDLPLPQAPATVSRANGQVAVRAIHLAEPLTVDGKLDESVYRDNLPVDGFIQTVPANGRPVSEKTEAWVMYDDAYIYICARLYDSAPPDKWIANELRRDTNQLRQNDMSRMRTMAETGTES